MRKTSVLVVVVVLLAAVVALAQSQEPLFGTWKMDVAKSKFSPGPAPKSSMVKWEAFQGGVKLTVDTVPAKGDTQHWEASGKFDGKDNPVKGNNPDADMVAFSKIDARTYETVQKRAGKTTITARMVMAPDGKTRTTTQTGKDGQGQTINNVQFYERQ